MAYHPYLVQSTIIQTVALLLPIFFFVCAVFLSLEIFSPCFVCAMTSPLKGIPGIPPFPLFWSDPILGQRPFAIVFFSVPQWSPSQTLSIIPLAGTFPLGVASFGWTSGRPFFLCFFVPKVDGFWLDSHPHRRAALSERITIFSPRSLGPGAWRLRSGCEGPPCDVWTFSFSVAPLAPSALALVSSRAL